MPTIKMKTKIEPRLIDIQYLDRELKRLFDSAPLRHGDPLFGKYKSRFLKQQNGMDKPMFQEDENSMLSVGKKLEILCMYGNHKIVKIDRKA